MKRRDFVALLGGAAAAPIVRARGALAQQGTLPMVGYLMSRSAEDAAYLASAFRDGLREQGFIDRQNVRIEPRWGDGDYTKLPALAKDLVQRNAAVIAAVGGVPSAAAARAATSTTPIVFGMSGDPIKMGFAASYNRPGGNVTGVQVLTTSLEPKRLGLLHQMAPQAKTIAAFVNANFAPSARQVEDFQDAARQLGLELRVFRITADREIDAAFDTFRAEQVGALAVAGAPYFDTRRLKLTALAERHRVPAIYHFREYVVAGGLMSYGIDIREVHRQIGRYTGQILKGAKPGELPIMLPATFELVINPKAAKAIGLAISQTLLATATEVIE
jgi:putative ABC transport system substrate-binding protein